MQSPPDDAREDGNTTLPTKSELHRVLSSARRRHVLDVLADDTRTFNLRELAEVVSERDEGDAQTDGSIERVAIELYHNHLPRLQDAGLVRYELESNRVKANHQAVSDLRKTSLL